MDSYTTFGTQLASLRSDEICDPVFAIETRKSENRKFGNTCCLIHVVTVRLFECCYLDSRRLNLSLKNNQSSLTVL